MQIGILKYRYMEKREKITEKKMSNPKLSFLLPLKNYKKVPITLPVLKNTYVQSISIQ